MAKSPREAVADLFEQFGQEIFAHVRLVVGNSDTAQDLVQDIFLHALRSWDRFEHRASPRTWLWAITRNVLTDHYRRRHHDLVQLSEVPELAANPEDPTDRVFLEEALAQLPLAQRRVFIMRVIEDRSSRETAQRLGWTEVRVRVTLHRAMKRMEQWWNGGERPGG